MLFENCNYFGSCYELFPNVFDGIDSEFIANVHFI